MDVDEYVVTEPKDRISSQQIDPVYSEELLDANQAPDGNGTVS